MTSRMGFALSVLLLLLAAVLRLWQLPTLPAGLHPEEINDVLIAGLARQGDIAVFYTVDGAGREGLYHTALAAVTSLTGAGEVGYHLFSAWAGMMTLAMTYAVVSRLSSPLAGVAAQALLTVNPWFMILSREVSREVLLPLLVLTLMLVMARALHIYDKRTFSRIPVTMPFAILGFLLGVGFYIHPAHFMIVLGFIVFIIWMLLTRQPVARQSVGFLLFGMLVAIIIAMPYLISSLRLPGLSGAARLLAGYDPAAYSPFNALVEGIVGIFFNGDRNPLQNVPGRPLIDLISGLMLLVGLMTALRNWRQPRYSMPLLVMLALLPTSFLRAHTPDFLAYSALLPLLALFFGVGVSTFVGSMARNTRWIVGWALLALLVFNLGWLYHDFFVVWPGQPAVQDGHQTRIGQLAYHLDTTAQRTPAVICQPGQPSTGLSSTDLLLLMMNRKDAPLRYADCGSGFILPEGGEGQQVVLLEPNTRASVHPYIGQWLDYGHSLQQDNLPADTIINLAVPQQIADQIGLFTTTVPAHYAPEAPGGAEETELPATFGGNLTFLGAIEENTVYSPGSIMTLITYWRVDGPLPRRLRLFTHILSGPDEIIAQTDTISVNVTQLQPRDIFIQVTFIPLPQSMPAGEYAVSIGAYRNDTLERMVVLWEGQPRGTRLFIAPITVEAE